MIWGGDLEREERVSPQEIDVVHADEGRQSYKTGVV